MKSIVQPSKAQLTKAYLSAKYDNEAEYGITYQASFDPHRRWLTLSQLEALPETDHEAESKWIESKFPDGGSGTMCTNYAAHVLKHFPTRAQVWGFANEDNPSCGFVKNDYHSTGHDFALIDSRFLVDAWATLVLGLDVPVVYDLRDDNDVLAVEDLYGSQENWTLMDIPLPDDTSNDTPGDEMIIRAYHGSGADFDQFQDEFLEYGADQNGSGFYFTTLFPQAAGYCFNRTDNNLKPGGEDNPTVYVVDLAFKNLMPSNHEMTFPASIVEQFIRNAPELDDCLTNWGDPDDGKERLIKEAVSAYTYDEPIRAQHFLNQMSNDFYKGHPRAFFELAHQLFGFDGIVDDYDGHEHYIAWFNEKIEIVSKLPMNSIGQASPMAFYRMVSVDEMVDIKASGIKPESFHKGDHGHGYYGITNYELAQADEGVTVAMYYPSPDSRLLDLSIAADQLVYQRIKLASRDDSYEATRLFIAEGVDGVIDSANNSLVIYNHEKIVAAGISTDYIPEPPRGRKTAGMGI